MVLAVNRREKSSDQAVDRRISEETGPARKFSARCFAFPWQSEVLAKWVRSVSIRTSRGGPSFGRLVLRPGPDSTGLRRAACWQAWRHCRSANRIKNGARCGAPLVGGELA